MDGVSTNPPVVLAIGGFDPTGSAGIIADTRVITYIGCHPCCVITCETVQTSTGLTGITPSDPELVEKQLSSLIEDIPLDIVKIGAIASVEIIGVIGRFLKKIPQVKVVLDPVFAPSNGPVFLDIDGMRAMSSEILEHVYLATPNLSELGAPAGFIVPPDDDDMIDSIAEGWLDAGVKNVLITGIERNGKIFDRLIQDGDNGEAGIDDFVHKLHNVGPVHGTGCVLSSAIASFLALGDDLYDSVFESSELASSVIEDAYRLGNGSAFWKGPI